MTYNNTLVKETSLRIKIFDPLSNKNWLEEKVNTWLQENRVEIIQINMDKVCCFTDERSII